MEDELNYLSKKIDQVEQSISTYEKILRLRRSLGLQHVLKCRKEELTMLNNILNKLTEIELSPVDPIPEESSSTEYCNSCHKDVPKDYCSGVTCGHLN